MKLRRSSAIRKKANRVKKLNELKEKRAKDQDLVDKENLTIKTRRSPRRKMDEFKVMVSESESEESIQERSKRKSQRLNISVAETESEDGIESIDMFDEEKEESGPGEISGLVSLGSRKPPRNSPRKRQLIYDIDDSDTDIFDAFENVNEENGGTGKEDSPRSSRLTDEEEVDDVDKTEVYSLKTVLVPLEDIGGLLQSYSNGRLTKDWMFSISRSKTSKKYRQSSSTSSAVSSNSDPNDDDFSLSESSISDSKESSSSGSNFSWESECESISSSNSWLPKRYISSSEEDSDSKSDELEEIEDDFVLHTKNKRELRKKKYALRQSNGAIRKKVAKYCNDEIEESTSIDSSDSSDSSGSDV